MSESRDTKMPIYVVTGANKGIGLAIVQRLLQEVPKPSLIYLAARNQELGEKAVEEARSIESPTKSKVEFKQLDITDSGSIKSFADFIANQHQSIDVLINNAGWAQKGSKFDADVVKQSLATNYYGTKNVCSALLPLINTGGRLVNVSSTAGMLRGVKSESLKSQLRSSTLTLSELDGFMQQYHDRVADGTYAKDWPQSAYGVSKIGVTAMTRVFAHEYKGKLLVNSVCPGHVATDMAGPNAPKTPYQGADTPVFLAVGDLKGQTGQFWRDRIAEDW